MENRFAETYNDITNQLLKRLAADGENNVVISPFSVLMLLGILADATGTETREEIAKILGCEKNLPEILEWLKRIQQEVTKSGALVSSNAVCVKHKLKDKIVSGYEEHLKESFGGSLFTAEDMVRTVNDWVNQKTKGMIPRIANESMNAMMACLMNAIVFEAKWQEKYEYDNIEPGDFHNLDGTDAEVSMMNSTEWEYIEDAHFKGFTRPYKNVGYSYMGLLPKKEGMDALKEAVASMDLPKLYQSRRNEEVWVMIPEYKVEFEKELKLFCESLGIERAFSAEADFDPMINERLKVEQILHKVFVQVDRNGTKAAAATIGPAFAGCVISFEEIKRVYLERPFVFAIVNDDTGLPVFVGVVKHLESGFQGADVEEIDGFMPQEHHFKSREERAKYAKALYRKLACRLHPDYNPLYDSNEEIRKMFMEASEQYRLNDVAGLEIAEHKIGLLFEKLRLDGDSIEARAMEAQKG